MKTGSWRNYEGAGRISISRSNPRRAPKGYRIYAKLAPGSWFKSVSKEEYLKRFAAQLEQLDAAQIWIELHELAGDDEPVLMCWEQAPFTDDNWCHRRLVADWFKRELGETVEELKTAQTALPLGQATKARVRASGSTAASKRSLAYPKAPPFPVLQPNAIVPDGEHRSVKGSKGTYYTVCNHNGQLFCDCPAYIFSRAPKFCKHLRGIAAEIPPEPKAR
jgi:hypothetical protein